jgi:hypothetical protein
MKRFLTSLVLIGVFCISTLAGEIPSVPGPQPSQPQSGLNEPGEIPSDCMTQSLSDAALSALMTALGLAAI